MKTENVKKLVEKMLNDQPVKLRGSIHNGISSVTWCHICDYLMAVYGVVSVSYDSRDRIIMHMEYANGLKVLVSNKITLY